MGPIQLFELASQQARWLSTRQAIVAQNISNANTPGYKAADVTAFESAFEVEQIAMATTNPRHIEETSREPEGISVRESNPWDIVHSGNSVSLEQQLMNASEINRSYSLNTTIVKAFSRMLLASVKG